ncbi:MAG: hypothetical protein AAF716_15500 [Cyanobacteria bacterium P01_D01_bin.1]
MALPYAGYAAMMSPMMAASPGALDEPVTLLLLISIVALPITLILGVMLAWLLFAYNRYGWAWRVALLPVWNVGLGAIALALFAFIS